MTTCQCCGHATNSRQTGGLCTGCEDLLNGIRNLPLKAKTHVLIRGTGASAAEIAATLDCGYSTNSSAMNSATHALGCSVARLVEVARYGLATKRFAVPDGFERPTHEAPTFDTPALRVQPRPEVPARPENPVVIEHREPIKQEEEQAVQIVAEAPEVTPEQRHSIAGHMRTSRVPAPPAGDPITKAIKPEPALNTVAPMAQGAVEHMLPAFRTEANDAALAYQDAFSGLAHLALTGDALPDFALVRAAYNLGLAKGRVEALEALA